MYSVSRTIHFQTISWMTRLYSVKKTHYEVLKVSRKCSDKEIKNAFIKLSKEYHPDKNKDVRAQEHFVRILEAYNVLGKPASRAHYDNSIVIEPPVYETYTSYNYTKPPSYYGNFYENQNKSQNDESNEDKPYYGINNVQKQPNVVIMFLCIGVAVFGFLIQFMLANKSSFRRRLRADEITRLNASELDKVRSAAMENGNERQIEILLERINSGSNPTIATAALGQSLANQKK